MAEALTGGALGLGAKSAVVGGDGAKRDRRRDNSPLERFQAKACPGLDPGWRPVRVKKTRQNQESRAFSVSILFETEKALALTAKAACPI